MKTIIKYGSLWLLPIAIYIFEIVWICIKGATLTNAICGWACCISITLLLAVRCVSDIYHSQKRLEDAEKRLKEDLEKYNNQLRDYERQLQYQIDKEKIKKDLEKFEKLKNQE